MGKFRVLNLKLETDQEATFGDNDEGKIYYDGSKLVVSGTGINVKLDPDNRVVLDGVAFPTDAGTFGQTLTLSGTDEAVWGAFSPGPAVGDRGVFGGGTTGSSTNTIDYITISSIGDATDWGDLTVARNGLAAVSNGANDRGVFAGGDGPVNVIDYITISTPTTCTDFGDLLVARNQAGNTSNGTNNRAIFGGGYTSVDVNVIDYITISVLGNATNFGDLSSLRRGASALSNATNNRGVFAGGYKDTSGTVRYDTIEYVTITSAGNVTDFGNLAVSRSSLGATSNGVNNRGVIVGGYETVAGRSDRIEYITIPTTANATDFGDLTVARYYVGGTSNGTNNRGVMAGGNSAAATYDNVIDYITISTTGNATNFGDLSVGRRMMQGATSNA